MIDNDNYIGQQIGHLRVKSKLGSGTFGSVYLAQNEFVAMQVAIKFMNAAYASSQQDREGFISEANMLAKLKHPNILPILDFNIINMGGTESLPYLVTEYAVNGSLHQLLDTSPQLLPLPTVLAILTQVGQALQYAHDHQIVHRDLKPANILFQASGEALLADFSIAIEIPESTITDKATGTPYYMAPEQFAGTVSKLGDQYGLGCIAYELVTGRKPFNGPNVAIIAAKHANEPPIPPRQLNPQLPIHIEQAILKAMAKDRKQRHTNVTAFITELNMSMAPPPPPQPPQPPSKTAILQSSSGQIALGAEPFTIGRAPENKYVVPNDPQMSRYHAVIRPEGQGYTIIDLDSKAKTFVNGQPIPPNTPRPLNHDDAIRVGNVPFVYKLLSSTPPPTGEPHSGLFKPWPPKWLTTRAFILASLALLVILSGAGIIFAHNSQVHDLTVAETDTAEANTTASVISANGIAQIHAATTAQAKVTATFQANITATAQIAATLVAATATASTPALSDPLSDNTQGNQWDVGNNCQFTSGSYQTSESNSSEYVVCKEHAQSFRNFAYKVDMTIHQGDCGGLAFRIDSADSFKNYVFAVCQDGTYYLYVGSTQTSVKNLINQAQSSNIHTGLDQMNTIAVIAEDDSISVYVNDFNTAIASVTDHTYSEGFVGLVAVNSTNTITDVEYTNAKVWV